MKRIAAVPTAAGRVPGQRLAVAMATVAAGLVLAGCGSTAASGTGARPSPSPSGRVRNGASGELVQINGTSLVLNATAGDVTVVYDTSTTFVKTSTGTFQDIVAGKCVVATGSKDATGTVTAAIVRLSDKVNGSCTGPGGGPGGPGGPGGGGGFGGARRSPSPGASPRANIAFAGGEVTAVKGTTVTVQPAAGAAMTVIVPTTVRVSKSAAATPAALALHECLTAQGPRDAAGKVTARTIAIVPAGPTGCFTGGGFGGFGRGPGGGTGSGGGPPAD